ncbi:MAG: protein phosphatase 2C domain-containing protein [Candidatus Nomurabacteria bacterium]|jgi:hypothetical protein|nr:protein phosphatase 2C domain-containing protein [Candidatus Nomurabacteria bacterium]
MIARKAISKIGAYHLFMGINRQDLALMTPDYRFKLVLDGCSRQAYSEVGVALFGQMIQRVEGLNRYNFVKSVNQIFAHLTKALFRDDNQLILQNLSFTILAVFETDDAWVVLVCGDGYILVQQDNELVALELSDGEYPRYFVYNWVDASVLLDYQDGVSFETYEFPKAEYDGVGVATDGYRFVENIPDVVDRANFARRLIEHRSGKVEQLINKHQAVFGDDISIVF